LVVRALALAGRNDRLRDIVFDALRQAEVTSNDRANFRTQVRWPLLLSLLADVKRHSVTLANGLIIEVEPESRIEQALLLSSEVHPNHVWEPQTTKLLVSLARETACAIVGGAYIGDHVLFLAKAMESQAPAGVVHAFEPMSGVHRRLLRNLELNSLANVVANQLALWSENGILHLQGPAALASTTPVVAQKEVPVQTVVSVSIDNYFKSRQLSRVGLIMLDTEGAEENALRGADQLLRRHAGEAPHLIFEVHRNHVDWSRGLAGTSIIDYVMSHGYVCYAIRDYHSNVSMACRPIEVIPIDRVYLDGPPHGFNVLATKDAQLLARMGLRIVEWLSPKLILDRESPLHQPLDSVRTSAA
jgi:FkbM family methyltransferase